MPTSAAQSHLNWQTAIHWFRNAGEQFPEDISALIEASWPQNHVVFPPLDRIFRCLELCPFHSTRVVILGQDPYHTPGVADGLAFSAAGSFKPPPSLRNILRESGSVSVNGAFDLTPWARQGVLLLNTHLSVASGKAGSHRHIGWESFTDCIIQTVDSREQPLVFMFWGAEAQRKKRFIASRHLVLEAPHPSPLSAHRGFIGCNHFQLANSFLSSHGIPAVDWRI